MTTPEGRGALHPLDRQTPSRHPRPRPARLRRGTLTSTEPCSRARHPRDPSSGARRSYRRRRRSRSRRNSPTPPPRRRSGPASRARRESATPAASPRRPRRCERSWTHRSTVARTAPRRQARGAPAARGGERIGPAASSRLQAIQLLQQISRLGDSQIEQLLEQLQPGFAQRWRLTLQAQGNAGQRSADVGEHVL